MYISNDSNANNLCRLYNSVVIIIYNNLWMQFVLRLVSISVDWIVSSINVVMCYITTLQLKNHGKSEQRL